MPATGSGTQRETFSEVLFGYKGQAQKWESVLTEDGQAAFKLLRRDLRETGCSLKNRLWRSFSKLRQLRGKPYHCHLTNSEVAVWYIEKQGQKILCIFTYLGQRKDAPY